LQFGVPPNRNIRRQIQKQVAREQKGSRAAALPSNSGIRTVIRVEPGTPVEEELLLLGALERLKCDYPAIRLEYATGRAEIARLLSPCPWFLKASHPIPAEESFARIVGNDFGLTLEEPDPEASHQAELAIYDRKHQAEVAKLQAHQQAAWDAGVKDLKVPIPEHNFHPRWHKSTGYYWQVVDQLGLPLEAPREPMSPYCIVPKSLEKETAQILREARLLTKSAVICDFTGEPAPVALLGAVAHVLPGLEIITRTELAAIGIDTIDRELAVLSHSNVRYLIAPVNRFLVTGWAAGVPNVLQVYTGGNPGWDGAHNRNNYVIARDRFTNDGIVNGLTTGLAILADKAKRKKTA
jgi:hypothetical protein